MANTFLVAQGRNVGKSLTEPDLVPTAQKVLAAAKAKGCAIVLPVDAVVAEKLAAGASARTVAVDAVGASEMILDVGPRTVDEIAGTLRRMKTWCGTALSAPSRRKPFDAGTIAWLKPVG